jgi:hypothetical protein
VAGLSTLKRSAEFADLFFCRSREFFQIRCGARGASEYSAVQNSIFTERDAGYSPIQTDRTMARARRADAAKTRRVMNDPG